MPGTRRPKTRASYKHDNPRKDVVLRRTIAEIGDEELVSMLEAQGRDDNQAQTMLGLMKRPPVASMTLARISQLAGYSRRDLVRMYGEYKADEMKVRLSRALPDLASDLVEDSKSVVHTCGSCKGAGVVLAKPSDDPLVGPLEEKCVECSGRGHYRTVGDHDARNMTLKVMGLIKNDKGVGVNINMQGGVETFDSLMSRVNDIKFDDKRTVDASAESVDE